MTDSMCAKLIGRADEHTYLIGSDEYVMGEQPPEEAAARVLDRDRGILFPPQKFHSITAHLPRLSEYTGSEGEVTALLDGVEVRGPSADHTPYALDTASEDGHKPPNDEGENENN